MFVRPPYAFAIVFCCFGCATPAPAPPQTTTLVTRYKSPERIRSALGVPPQQMQQGGQLWETYVVGDERITVHYEPSGPQETRGEPVSPAR